jgi:hypothetical protein
MVLALSYQKLMEDTGEFPHHPGSLTGGEGKVRENPQVNALEPRSSEAKMRGKKTVGTLAAALVLSLALGCGPKEEEKPAARGDHALGGYVQAVDKAKNLRQNMNTREATAAQNAARALDTAEHGGEQPPAP